MSSEVLNFHRTCQTSKDICQDCVMKRLDHEPITLLCQGIDSNYLERSRQPPCQGSDALVCSKRIELGSRKQ